MKNLFIFSALLVSIVSFSQSNQKETGCDSEKDINVRLDSLSKVYHVNVVNYTEKSNNGIRTISIGYIKNGELVDKIIKTDTLNIPSQK